MWVVPDMRAGVKANASDIYGPTYRLFARNESAPHHSTFSLGWLCIQIPVILLKTPKFPLFGNRPTSDPAPAGVG